MKLLRHIISIVCIVAPFIANAGEQLTAKAKGAANQPTAAELNRLQGYEGEGAGGKCSITITGNSLHYRVGANWHETTFVLPANKDPQQLHATIKDCWPPSKDAIGKVVFAIFTIEDGTLTLAVDMPDEPPKTFASATSHYVVKKVEPPKKKAEPPKTK